MSFVHYISAFKFNFEGEKNITATKNQEDTIIALHGDFCITHTATSWKHVCFLSCNISSLGFYTNILF